MKYRGYYIDGVTFTCKADIDAFIKNQQIKRLQFFNNRMLEATIPGDRLVCSIEADKAACYLHNYCGMEWSEIEAIEFAS